MAQKMIVPKKVEEERTYRNLKQDLDVLPNGHKDRARKQDEMAAVKAKINQGRGKK